MKTRINIVTKNILSQGEDKYPTDSMNVTVIDAPFINPLHHYKVNSKNDGIEARTKAEIDATLEEVEKTAKANRIAEIRTKLTSMTPAQLDNYVDNNVTDMASTRTYLKRLTLVVRNIALDTGTVGK